MRVGIIGAGPIGSYLGQKLSESGEEVFIFEKKRSVGKEACSGLISSRLWDHVPKKKLLIENKINYSVLHFKNKSVKINFNPEMHVVSRTKLDKYFVKRAEKSGARIFKNHELRRVFHFKNHRPQISVQNKRKTKVFEFDRLIGCDGSDSSVRKQMKLSQPKMRTGIIVYKNKRDKSNFVDIWPTNNGFTWRLPRGKKTEYGILEDIHNAKREFNKFSRKNKVSRKKLISSLVPQGLITSGSNNVALCGDAAGLTKPWSGGGIIWGLRAADMLVESFPNIQRYNRKLNKTFSPRIFYSKLVEKLIKFTANNIHQLIPKELTIDSDWVF